MDARIEKLLFDIKVMVAYAGCLTDNGIKILLEKAIFDFESRGVRDEV